MSRWRKPKEPFIPFDSLAPEEQRRCRQINLRLREIEAYAHQRALAVNPELRARVGSSDDPLDDFEVDLKLDFQLREDDPAFCEGDNYIASQMHPLGGYHIPPKPGEYDEQYHWGREEFPQLQRGEAPHCRSYRELCSICGLSWHDVARIGAIHADVLVYEQLYREIP